MARTLPDIVFSDDDIIIVNKPHGLLTIPSRDETESNLRDLLSARFGDVLTVHRIDRDTSGIVLFARNAEVHKALSQQFQERSVEKSYLAIVVGNIDPSLTLIDVPLEISSRGKTRIQAHGKPSTTKVEIVESFRGYSLLRVFPLTGRQHQIRIHLSYIGHPLIIDPVYGSDKSVNIADIKQSGLNWSGASLTPLLQRTPLHAFSLRFTLGTEKYFEAPVPKDINATLKQLRKWRAL